MSSRPAVVLATLLAVTMASGRSARPVAPTVIVILGTIHGDHASNKRYTPEALRDIIVALEPAAILVELPPTIGGRPTVVDGRRAPWLAAANEGWAQNAAADSLGVALIPYDREGRNEYYARTRYFARRDSASVRLDALVERIRNADSVPLVPLLYDVYQNISRSQRELHRTAPPEVINSAAFDELIRAKRRMDGDIVRHLVDFDPELGPLAAAFRFLADEWVERNAVMADNILKAARRYGGERIVVLAGSEHRYALRERLQQSNDVSIREYWELIPVTSTGSPGRGEGT